ncbi:S24 family peptidase [Variovorax paradoxus]|nr:S24 family peptidase [Variovorax paradoxus]
MKELNTYVDAVIVNGKSIKSQAEAAKVNVSTLRRLVLKDPRYEDARKAGKISSKDYSPPEELRKSELVIAVTTGQLTIPQAMEKFGLQESAVRNRIKKAYPDFFSKRNWTITPTQEIHVATVAPPAGPVVTQGVLPVITWEQAREWTPEQGALQTDESTQWMASPVASSQHSYILPIEDNAMTAPPGAPRSFPVGSKIFVDCAERAPAEGDRVLARVKTSGELVFRVFHNVGGVEWLEPLNPMHLPIRDEFKVIGHVFGKWEDA